MVGIVGLNLFKLMEKHYDHKTIESKWQRIWEENKVFAISDDLAKPKYYCLIEFPYPSGDGLHVGHVESHVAIDIVARKKRLEGFNVLYPIGWDAFGLPTENYAIKIKQPPQVVTRENIKKFRQQIKRTGISFDWGREINTTDPQYFKWTQWIFLQLYKNNLAYKAKIPINWCPACKIGLANEEVIDNNCERCGAKTSQREIEQWILRITKYADCLINDLDMVDYLPRIREQQINWVGRSEGVEIEFKIQPASPKLQRGEKAKFKIKVFTTRPDTLFGATYLVVAPEHELISALKAQISNWKEVEDYLKKSQSKSELERQENKDKTGVKLEGWAAINPVNNQAIPIYVADYVLITYGTGAIMAVPAHDERDFAFAQKFGLEIIQVIKPATGDNKTDELYTGEGTMINSDEFNGLNSEAAKVKIIQKVKGKKTSKYKLRDWVFSRQHYWGEPIPIVYCRHCLENSIDQDTNFPEIQTTIIAGLEYAVVPVPEKDLPVTLPLVEKYEPTDTGESPLAAIDSWVRTKCPQCGGLARRETDTMPNWAGSSWYYLRYIDPRNDRTLADMEKLRHWTPVDLYNGGMEHTTLHLLYSRFWHKFLYDIKVVPTPEPYAKRISHGMILAEDGQKMSKSRGNVINPDEVVSEYGADTIRLYEMFMGPYEDAKPWSTKGISGVRRFLEKLWLLVAEWQENGRPEAESLELNKLFHKTLKKVTKDIESFKFNTAVSSMMILVNQLAREKKFKQENLENFLIILSCFAPHLAEEIWSGLGHKDLICRQTWPVWDENKVKDEEKEIAVQVNGKVRAKLVVGLSMSESEVFAKALEADNVQRYVNGKKIVKQLYIPGKLVSIVLK